MKKKRRLAFNLIMYTLFIVVGIVMIFPLLWLFSGSFKENKELFSSLNLIPHNINFNAYVKGWSGVGPVTFTNFFINTFLLVVPTTLFTLISGVTIGYGFTRFNFPFKKILFMLMISSLMLPGSIIMIPRYLLFRNLGWLNSYRPFTIPALLGCFPFFNFMMVQFFRGIPRELDESAFIDGANSFTTFVQILLPLCKPALFSVAIIQFIWTWNDFFNSLIYINSVSKFPLTLGLRMALDGLSVISWNQVMAMSILSILPPILIFFFAQKYFVEGIATTGLKG